MRIEDGLIAADTLTKRGGAAIVKNTGKIIAVITAAVAVILTFAEVTFAGFDSRSFTSTLAVMLVASYLIYFSLEDAGERLGEESAAYREAVEKYERLKEQISGADAAELREWCAEYSSRELDYRRSSALLEAGISAEEYAAYEGGAEVPRERRRAFLRIRRMRAVPLTPARLLSRERRSARCELADRGRFKLLRMAAKLIPTTVFTCVTVSVMLTLKDGMTAADVAESIVKLSSLPVIGIRGYAAGYAYIRDFEIPRTDLKRRILEAFVADREK